MKITILHLMAIIFVLLSVLSSRYNRISTNDICPVKQVDIGDTPTYLSFGDQIIGFCCPNCAKTFTNTNEYPVEKSTRIHYSDLFAGLSVIFILTLVCNKRNKFCPKYALRKVA